MYEKSIIYETLLTKTYPSCALMPLLVCEPVYVLDLALAVFWIHFWKFWNLDSASDQALEE